MKNNDGNTERVKRQIKEALDKIQQEKLLSERECLSLKEQINGLPIEKELKVQEEKTLGLEELLQEFQDYAKQSSSKLENMLSIISSGCIPNKEERDAFEEILDKMSKQYNQVCELAKEILESSELPEDGSSINTYYEAIKNSKSVQLQEQLENIKSVLNKFVSVKTLVDNLAGLLLPFQDAAKEILLQIDNKEFDTMESLGKRIEAPSLFVAAIECADIDSEEGEQILDTLDELGVYPAKLTRALSKGHFYIENLNNEEKIINVSRDIIKKSQIENPESNDIIAEAIVNESENTKLTAAIGNSFEQDSELVDNEVSDEIQTDFTKKVIEENLFVDEEDFGVLSNDISAAESKKISASIFTNDLRKGNLKALKEIVKQVDGFSIISPETMVLKYKMSLEMAEVNLNFLKNKGYLRKYTIIPGGEFYCSSPRLEKSLVYKEASRLVGVKQRTMSQIAELIEDKASSATARLAYLNMYNLNARVIVADKIAKITSSSVFYTEAFIYKMFDSEKPLETEIFTGIFWTNVAECDDYLEGIKTFVQESDAVEKLIVCALNVELAKKYVNILLEENMDKLESSLVYLYSTTDNCFYKYDKTMISEDEIWSVLKENEEELEERTSEKQILNKDENSVVQSFDKTLEMTELDHLDIVESVTVETISSKTSIDKVISGFLINKKFYCVPPYVKALALKDVSNSALYDQVAYALNDPMKRCTYSADAVFDIISINMSALSDYFVIAIGLRTFFSNQVRYDYNIKGLYNAIKDKSVLSEYPSLSNVMYKLVGFKEEYKKGLDAYADYKAKSVAQLDDELKRIQREAKLFYESIIVGKKIEKTSHRRFLETKRLLFNVNGDIGQYINAVVENDKEVQPLILSFVQENFIKEGNVVLEDTIDADMLWDFIMTFWNRAGEKMIMKFSSDLMSRLRSNIVSTTTKAIQILIRWCNIVEKLNDQTEDAGSIAYKKIRKPLLDDIEETIGFIEKDIRDLATVEEEKAGLEIIRYTLDEINRCINGTYGDYEKKYFYASFMFNDKVLLDESYCPDLAVRSAEIADMQPEKRILDHINGGEKTPEERLKEILSDGGDDYGTARLLVEYLEEVSPEFNVSIYKESIQNGEEYAKETADIRKEQFIGDLELAQSYGQIDNSNSKEDKKEKILQIVNEWYDFAIETSNYGFFERVMESYLTEIRCEAKCREKDLMTQFEKFKTMSIKGISTDVKERKIAKIQEAIVRQNYTVAEDLLGRVTQLDEDIEIIVEESFLRNFLDDYSDYYKMVAQCQNSLAMLVKNRTRNKEERGGKRLAENWLPGGSCLGRERLIGLLKGLGFDVDDNTVWTQDAIGKFENFLVKTISAKNGKRANYTHPIAAFGSSAAQEGFRVVCLNGKYDAANLIDVMKQIGNAKHTMILLDCALDKTQRRTLARKSKSELGDKLFVVIDRTVMIYIIKNYDETKVNRMLMSLIVPFGYYQPYVFKSSDVMPPEIFMGRKMELESIESASGANIVYGGRQLGKSALLKKAKFDIDHNENGDRAVLIDIKELNYQEVAKKIGHALYDEGILKDDITTTDWDELTRVIRRRLQSDMDPIPYLLLLMDEADMFIESCKEINYRPFDALKEIQSIGVGRFKFVIAGLHNVVRFQKDAALGNNSVLTHLDHITVKPFKSTEARELMEIPLHYLGLEFPKENEALITLILATANYFPGLIQLYCAKLLSAMRNKDYAGYAEADTPIYEISEEHIKKVLADSEFMEQIREKFIITLKLDEDNYYYLIALIIAYLYHNNGYNLGYSVADIQEAAKELNIAKISTLDVVKLEAFMKELMELNVLRNTDETHYLFTRFSFFQMMGTRTEVEDHLLEYMEDNV